MKKYFTIIATVSLVLLSFFTVIHYSNSGNYVMFKAAKQNHDDPGH
ncbi:hypothetical protein SAM19_05312 [Brevibacillus laterosporus]|nr:hypothetical protein [Brevibacillus laterosporus]